MAGALLLIVALPLRAATGPIAASLARGDVLQEALALATADEVARVNARMDQYERVADATARCIREAAVIHGADLVSTASALKFCPTCAEANPAGFSVEARIGLKIGALGLAVERCYHDAKSNSGKPGIAQWANRIVTLAAVVLNVGNAINGKPIIKWGTK